jgi:phage shock protein A
MSIQLLNDQHKQLLEHVKKQDEEVEQLNRKLRQQDEEIEKVKEMNQQLMERSVNAQAPR